MDKSTIFLKKIVCKALIAMVHFDKPSHAFQWVPDLDATHKILCADKVEHTIHATKIVVRIGSGSSITFSPIEPHVETGKKLTNAKIKRW